MTLERIALDLCQGCLAGNREVLPAYPGAYCRTEGCALYDAQRPYLGLREHVKVMWPAPLLACVDVLRKVSRRACATMCMTHEILSTSHHPDCMEFRAVLSAWDRYLDEGGDGSAVVDRAARNASTLHADAPAMGTGDDLALSGAADPSAPLVIRCTPAHYSPAAVIRPGPAPTLPEPAPAATQDDGGGAPADPPPWFMRCPWCKSVFRALVSNPSGYEYCPLCYGSFSFGKRHRVTPPADLATLARSLGCETPEEVQARLHSEEAQGMDAREFLNKRGGVE